MPATSDPDATAIWSTVPHVARRAFDVGIQSVHKAAIVDRAQEVGARHNRRDRIVAEQVGDGAPHDPPGIRVELNSDCAQRSVPDDVTDRA